MTTNILAIIYIIAVLGFSFFYYQLGKKAGRRELRHKFFDLIDKLHKEAFELSKDKDPSTPHKIKGRLYVTKKILEVLSDDLNIGKLSKKKDEDRG